MNRTSGYCLVFITAPDMKAARSLAKAALKARLVACVNLFPKIEAHYWWQGKIDSAAEALMILKTSRGKLGALEKVVVSNHPYDTPEFLVIEIAHGNRKYLDWLKNGLAT